MTRSKLIFPTVLAAGALTVALGMTTRPLAAESSRLVAPAIPAGEVTVRLKDFTVSGPARVYAGRNTIRVINDGPLAHEVAFVRLAEGKTAEDLYSWFRAGMTGAAPGEFVGGTVALSAGGASTITEDLTPGRYLLLSFRPSSAAPDEPYVAQGTILELQVK